MLEEHVCADIKTLIAPLNLSAIRWLPLARGVYRIDTQRDKYVLKILPRDSEDRIKQLLEYAALIRRSHNFIVRTIHGSP